VARAVDENHAMRLRELFAEREAHILHIAARTMDQNDGGLSARATTRKTELGHVKPHAFDLHELPGWRMCGLNARNAEHGHGDEHPEHKGECDDGSRGRHARMPVLC
jgi:hypothetical protein